MNTTPSHTRVATFLVIGVLTLPILVGIGVVWYVLAQPASEATVVTLRVDAPQRVVEGDTFDLRVTLHNATGRPIELVGIDLSGDYLDGFVLIRTEPDYLAEEEGPVFRAFDYDIEIPANGDAHVVLRVQAVAAGDYTGDLDARLTGSTGLLTERLSTTITAPGSSATPGPDDGEDPLTIQPSEN